ncbi:hypothetical protein GCM10018987_10750 [Streptomyces cremeus]
MFKPCLTGSPLRAGVVQRTVCSSPASGGALPTAVSTSATGAASPGRTSADARRLPPQREAGTPSARVAGTGRDEGRAAFRQVWQDSQVRVQRWLPAFEQE